MPHLSINFHRIRYYPEERYKDRLLCVEVPREAATVTTESVKTAVEDLKKRLYSQLESMRKQEGEASARDGRTYSFYAHMFVNAEMALREL
jgi:hypothetical protein